MPFDGNGNWTSNFSAVADRNANIKIEASRFDNILLADIAQSFETCLTKDMQVKPQQNFDANNFRLINVADPTTGSDAVNLSTLNTKDGTAVHKAGTETITGNKTFSGSNTFSGSVSLGALATATSPSASDSSTKVATTAWVNTVGNNVMHLTGNESVSGNKTFSGSNTFTDYPTILKNAGNFIVLKNTDITAGIAPSATKQSLIKFLDSNNNSMGTVYQNYNADGSVDMRFNTAARGGGNSYTATFTLRAFPDGTRYATCPTPSSPTDNSTNIATTEWVAGHMTTTQPTTTSTASVNAPDTVVENYYDSSTRRWYIKFSSGFIIQGGTCNPTQSSFNDDDQFTVTFVKPFVTTDYTILKNIQNNTKATAYHRELGFTSKTTTNAKTYASGNYTSYIAFGW